MKTHGWWPLLWAALVGIALFTRPPLPVDETRYLSVAWEMWQGNQFLVPHSNGVAYSHKPPLLFWLMHFGWWLFGVNSWTARLIPPLFGFGAILLTVRIGRILWPEDKEMAGALPFFLLGMLFWSMYATLTMFDMLVTFFCLTAYLGFLRARQGNGAGPWLLAALAVALGLLAKGPVILLYLLPPAMLAPWWGQGQCGSWPRWYASLALAVAGGIMLALCWAIPAARAGGTDYGHAILFSQTAGRLVRSFAHERPWFWYALWLPLLLFPWIFWGPVWRGGRQVEFDAGIRFCLSAVIPSFVLLCCISGKQVHYLLPLLPAVALLMARAAGVGAGTRATDFRQLATLLFLVGVVLFVLPRLHFQGGDAKMLVFLPPWLGVIPALAGLAFTMQGNSSIPQGVTRVAVFNVVLMCILHLALSGPLQRLYDQAVIGAALRSAEESGSVIAAYPARLKDQFQFAGRLGRPLLPMDSLGEVGAWAEKNPGQYCLIFTNAEGRAWLQGRGNSKRFRGGWLVARPAKGLNADYLQWESAATGQDDYW
ncbi:MAG: ArnT family glycosyltransferase [Desulfobulbaceae bacterium]